MSKLNVKRPTTLSYEFVAHYEDDSRLYQNYGEEGEANFGDIDQDKLKVFELTNGNKSIKLDIKTGEFDINGQKIRFVLPSKPVSGSKNRLKAVAPKEYRLIYFRRIRQRFGGVNDVTTRHAVGWQTTVDGTNYQRIIFIEPDGSLTFENKK